LEPNISFDSLKEAIDFEGPSPDEIALL